jgi:hypothetical protein
MTDEQPPMTSAEIDAACMELGVATVLKALADPAIHSPRVVEAMHELVARVDANMGRLLEAARDRIQKADQAGSDE